MSHDVPQDAWEKIGVDFFEFRSVKYLILADYYSRFPIVRRMRSTTAAATIDVLKQVFSEHGIPKTLMSDNGPQFTSKEFKDFACKYNFTCAHSSPRYSQSNGLIEKMVGTVTQCMTRSMEAGDDPYLAMLVYRSTPLTNKIPSPAELLNGRKYRALLPTRPQKQATNDTFRDQMIQDKARSAEQYDRHAKDLPELPVNRKVYVQLDPDKPEWTNATVTNQTNPRCYDVTTDDGRTFTRNRRFLKPDESPTDDQPQRRVVKKPERLIEIV